ncbi:unnamed protein product [Chilo suppressalis]|uniref:BTB domain-containing protein n=1 Tax=Chilo suppressalis TaxID=168631 RepID=A0ABN8B6J4_CHISP|nr:unnamed protein product [Chilo suppressalis]
MNESRQFKAHKVILAACSKHFQELFDTAPPSHAGACYVILEATTADNMQALLEFMYKGEVHVKGLSMEMSKDAWVKQQAQQSSDRHQTRIKTSPVSGSGNCEVQESGPPQPHTATFAPMPQYGLHMHSNTGTMGRQSSSSSHCGSVADEPDTRSSPGAGPRYEDNPPDCTSTLGNPTKNNGYERSASVNDEMMERLSNDQGAEAWLPLHDNGNSAPRYKDNPLDCSSTLGNPTKNNGYERSASVNDEMMERLSNDQGAEDLRVKNENDYHQSGYNNSPPPPTPLPPANYHDKPAATSPVPPKPSPDLWPPKPMITSKSGGIATADGYTLLNIFYEKCFMKAQ